MPRRATPTKPWVAPKPLPGLGKLKPGQYAAACQCQLTFIDPAAFEAHLKAEHPTVKGTKVGTPDKALPGTMRVGNRRRFQPEAIEAGAFMYRWTESKIHTPGNVEIVHREGQFWCDDDNNAAKVWVIPTDAPGTLVRLHVFKGTGDTQRVVLDYVPPVRSASA